MPCSVKNYPPSRCWWAILQGRGIAQRNKTPLSAGRGKDMPKVIAFAGKRRWECFRVNPLQKIEKGKSRRLFPFLHDLKSVFLFKPFAVFILNQLAHIALLDNLAFPFKSFFT